MNHDQGHLQISHNHPTDIWPLCHQAHNRTECLGQGMPGGVASVFWAPPNLELELRQGWSAYIDKKKVWWTLNTVLICIVYNISQKYVIHPCMIWCKWSKKGSNLQGSAIPQVGTTLLIEDGIMEVIVTEKLSDTELKAQKSTSFSMRSMMISWIILNYKTNTGTEWWFKT